MKSVNSRLALMLLIIGAHGLKEKLSNDLPCPEADDIFPCICQYDDDYDIIMDCSGVMNEPELQNIFSQEIPFKNFKELMIEENHHLSSLPDGVFGDVTFVDVFMDNNLIEDISSGVFRKSVDTLKSLQLANNGINDFPFEDLSSFSNLKHVELSENKFDTASMANVTIASTSITALFLDSNSYYRINYDDLDLPSAEELSFCNCGIVDIETDVFTRMIYLNYLALSHNNLTLLRENIIDMHGNNSLLFLDNNEIYNVTGGAIKGVTGAIHLEHNKIEVFPEAVWRPILEELEKLYLYDNPLLCGCDIAWLILSPELLSKLEGSEECFDGQKLTDLDPAMYEKLCG